MGDVGKDSIHVIATRNMDSNRPCAVMAYEIVSDLCMTLFPRPMAFNYYGRRMLVVHAIRSIVSL